MKLSSTEIKKYLASKKYDFKRFKMHYTTKEILAINTFKINKAVEFSYLGSYKNLKNINEFLSTLGNNDILLVNKMEKIINNIIKKVLKGYNMEYFWMDIRVTMPSNMFDTPRWHKDGTFFPPDMNEMGVSKFATALKGPGTLLIKSTKRINEIYNKCDEQEFNEMKLCTTMEERIKIDDKYRPILAKKFSKEPIIQLKNNQGLVFFAATPNDIGALHSEPKFDVPRMFISILPNTEENIIALKKSWN